MKTQCNNLFFKFTVSKLLDQVVTMYTLFITIQMYMIQHL